MRIVGIVGFIGSGKGTVGDILEEYGYTKESFAWGVKDTASAMFGWKRELLEGDTEESREFREKPCPFWSNKMGRDFTPREALQKMGTEVGRNIFHEDFWVLSLESRLKQDGQYVITDVRFPNEIEWIRKMGGQVFEVQRGEQPQWMKPLRATNDPEMRKMLMIGNDTHYSEWAWIGCKTDGIIKNGGTKEDLTNTVKSDIM